MTNNLSDKKGLVTLSRTPAKFLGLALCVVLALPISQSFAASTSRPQAGDPRIEKLKGELEYVSKQEAAEVQKFLTLKAESQKATSNLASINKKIADAEARKQAAHTEAENARAEFAAAQARYDTAVKESKDAHSRRSQAIVRLYQEAANPDAVPSIISSRPEDRQAVIRKSSLMENYNQSQIDAISKADAKANDAQIEKLAHEDARLRAEAAEKVAADEEAALEPLRIELAAAQKVAKDNEAAVQGIVNGLKTKKAEYTKQMNQLQAESNALAQQIKKQQQGSTTPVAPGKMKRPVSAAINSPFGYRLHPIYGDQRLHAGIDFNASYGTAIGAAKNGKVIYASTMSGYGNVIIVDHGGGVSSLYAHQSSFAVGLNATVIQGQTIGYVGATGNVTGPHLHFEVRLNGTPVDPMGYF